MNEEYNPINNSLHVYCKLICLNGKAPTEGEIDLMYNNLKRHIDSKGGKFTELRETQYWNEAIEAAYQWAKEVTEFADELLKLKK